MSQDSKVVRLALPPVSKEYVEGLRKEAEVARSKYLLLNDACVKAEKEYLKTLQRFKDLDYQLALVDGRLKKLDSASSKKKEKKMPELSLDQIKSIANKLGINIPSNEDEEGESETLELVEEVENEEEI